MNNIESAIVSALDEIGADELFDRIIEAQSPICDALVFYDNNKGYISVESVMHGNTPLHDDLILLHREEAKPIDYDYGFGYQNLFDDDEIDFVTGCFDGGFSDYLDSRHNHRGSLKQRIEDVRRFHFIDNWYETTYEWAERAVR